MKVSLSLESLCQIFGRSFNDNSNVFWANTVDYTKTIYVHPTFEAIWGIKTETLIEHPRMFDEYLISDNRNFLISNWVARHNLQETDVVYYQIKK